MSPQAIERQRAVNDALFACVVDAMPAGYVMSPTVGRDPRRAMRAIRIERPGPIARGEQFENITISAGVIPGTDSLRVGAYPQSGTYVDDQGVHTLDEPARGSVRQAAAKLQKACEYVAHAP